MFKAIRYHDISCGHRVYQHESKCQHLHGHNYRIHFHCASNDLDKIGRTIDFSAIKEKLCMWVEEHWDHKFLVWENDPLAEKLQALDKTVVAVPFNPTAEKMAEYLVEKVGPVQLNKTGVVLESVEVEETRKCKAEYVSWTTR